MKKIKKFLINDINTTIELPKLIQNEKKEIDVILKIFNYNLVDDRNNKLLLFLDKNFDLIEDKNELYDMFEVSLLDDKSKTIFDNLADQFD